MPSEVIRCPECDRTQRYARPTLKRIARDSEGKAILKEGEPIFEMAYMCRGGHIFYHVEGQRPKPPKAIKKLVDLVLEEIAKNKKEKEHA